MNHVIPATAIEEVAAILYDIGEHQNTHTFEAVHSVLCDSARMILEAAAPHMLSASTAAMATIIREHWAAEVPHPMYPTYVQCMARECEWDGRFLGDISEHVAELIAAEATK